MSECGVSVCVCVLLREAPLGSAGRWWMGFCLCLAVDRSSTTSTGDYLKSAKHIVNDSLCDVLSAGLGCHINIGKCNVRP